MGCKPNNFFPCECGIESWGFIRYISGVAKLLDSPSHFSKFENFREPQLNTYLKYMQNCIKKLQKLYLLKTHK